MAIQLNNVNFAYPEAPDELVLNIANWSISAQEHVFVHGPSGGGKSTLLNLVSGVLAASSGEVTILGQRLDTMNARQRDRFRANHIGYIFQQFNLISYLSAIDNIQLAHQFANKDPQLSITDEIKTLLSSFNIAQSDWLKPVSKLSIGQQQRIAIARAMINKPQLLIADEPTSSLDQNNRDNFMEQLMLMVAEHNITLLLVSHDMSLAQYFGRIDALSDINIARDSN